jgi:hypothetical protein
VAWISGIAGFFKSLWGAGAVQQAPPRAVRSRGEQVSRVSDSEMTACLFCGRTASRRSLAVAVQLDCSTCGPCEVTVEAMGLLREDENLRKAVLRQMRRHFDSGAERPLVDLAFIQSLKGR